MKVKAQAPFGSAYFENCYQSFAWGVSANDTLKVRLLDLPSGRSLRFSVPVNPLDINGYLITYFQENNGSFFPVSTTIVESNGNLTIPIDVPMIQINPINNTGGWAGYYPAVGTFVSPDSAFIVAPSNDTCFSYNSFSFSSTIQLDGLCGMVEYSLKNSGGSSFGPLNISPNTAYELDGTDYCNPSWVDPCELPPPCPRCTEFTLQIMVHPCPGMEIDPDCPPLLINKPIEICCFCGPEEFEP